MGRVNLQIRYLAGQFLGPFDHGGDADVDSERVWGMLIGFGGLPGS
jgi:hypothetical protein